MTTLVISPQPQNHTLDASVQRTIESMIDDLVASLPDNKQLTSNERRGIIARYASVLEGNFIYWMTAAYLSVRSEEAQPLLIENLTEEVRDAHPDMLRRFYNCSPRVSNRR